MCEILRVELKVVDGGSEVAKQLAHFRPLERPGIVLSRSVVSCRFTDQRC